MSDIVPVIRVKPSHKSQGDYVEINEADFDPKIHEKLSKAELEKIEKAEAKKAEADEAPADEAE